MNTADQKRPTITETGEAAIKALYRDLALCGNLGKASPDVIVATTQATVREVLLEIERLRDRVEHPECYITRYTLPSVKLTEEEKARPSPVPVIPWRDYGNPRHG